MPQSFFSQTVIAVVWDFDKTLVPGYMQEPLFRAYGIPGFAEGEGFWNEVQGLPQFYRDRGLEIVSPDVLYLDHMLMYVRAGRFPGLTNRRLRELGGEIEFYPGVPEIFEGLQQRPKVLGLDGPPHKISVEHYVISTGLRQMILGSGVQPFLTDVWGCEFVETIAEPGYLNDPPDIVADQPIAQVGYSIDNTTKTRAIFEINKGVNISPRIQVNAAMAQEDRRVPLQNMIYVADGPSDVPVFSILKTGGGKTFAVYKPGSDDDFDQAKALLEAGRVDAFGEANYVAGSTTAMWLVHSVDEIARRIASQRDAVLETVLGSAPSHLP